MTGDQPAWVGWFRTPHLPWRAVCEAETWHLCWLELDRYSSRVAAPLSSLYVGPYGVHPDDPIGKPRETRRLL